MRRFLGSAWFPFLACILFAAGTVAAYAILKPVADDVSNEQLLRAFRIAGWAAGPVMALLSFIGIGILNGIRRIVRLRNVGILHPVIVLLGIAPWLAFGWELVMVEPRFTPFARAAIDFVGKPMLHGALVGCAFALLGLLLLLFPKKK